MVMITLLKDASPARALGFGGVTILAIIVPLLLIIRRQVAAGKWSDADVSVHSERRGFYGVLILVVGLSCAAFWLLDFPRSFLLGMLISLVLLVAAAFINRYSKISLHLIFAFYCAVLLAAVSPLLGTFFILLAAAVGWSRVVLRRHTLGQVLSGAALGSAAGIFLLILLGVI